MNLLRDCYLLRSDYDRKPVIGVSAVIIYAELLLRDVAHDQEPPPFGWFRRAA